MSRIIRHVIEIEVAPDSKKVFASTTGRIAERAAEMLVLMYEEKGHKILKASFTQESFWRQFKNTEIIRQPVRIVRRKVAGG